MNVAGFVTAMFVYLKKRFTLRSAMVKCMGNRRFSTQKR